MFADGGEALLDLAEQIRKRLGTAFDRLHTFGESPQRCGNFDCNFHLGIFS
jgi:hypothetical protein